MSHLYPLDQPDTIYPKDVKIDFHLATIDDINNPSFFQTLYDVYKFGFPDDARNPKFFHDVMNLQQLEKAATGENRNCYDLICATINLDGKTDLVGIAAASRFMAPRGGWINDPIDAFSGMDYRSVLPRARKRGIAEKFAEFAAERARDHAVKLGLVSRPEEAEIFGFNDMSRAMRTPFGTVHADWHLAKQHVIARVRTWNNQGYLRVLPNPHVDTYYEPAAAAYGDHDCVYYSRNIRLKPGQTIHRETLMDLEWRNASLRRMNGGNPNTEPTGQFARMMDQIGNGPERLAAVRDIEDLEPFIDPTQQLLDRYPVQEPVKENYPGSLPDDIARERLGTLLAREFGLKIPAHL